MRPSIVLQFTRTSALLCISKVWTDEICMLTYCPRSSAEIPLCKRLRTRFGSCLLPRSRLLVSALCRTALLCHSPCSQANISCVYPAALTICSSWYRQHVLRRYSTDTVQTNNTKSKMKEHQCRNGQTVKARTMSCGQRHSCRSGSYRCSFHPDCRRTAALRGEIHPSTSFSLLPGPATRTRAFHLEQTHFRQHISLFRHWHLTLLDDKKTP